MIPLMNSFRSAHYTFIIFRKFFFFNVVLLLFLDLFFRKQQYFQATCDASSIQSVRQFSNMVL